MDALWPEVVAVAGRLAQVMVGNDLGELVAVQESEAEGQPTNQPRTQGGAPTV